MPINYVDTIGRYGLGNIDLNNRIVVHNADGTFSTERSFSINIDGLEVLLPTVIYGQIESQNDAITHYLNTGEYLGKFNTVAAAETYAEELHERQEWYYTVGAFNGSLVFAKVGNNYIEIPQKLIKAESYRVTPNQRFESSANRSVTGMLVRQTVSHTASKIEFETIPMTQTDVKTIEAILNSAYVDSLQRKLKIKYYDTSADDYKEGDFYVPDVEYSIQRIDLTKNKIHYNSIRYAFIEY